MKHYKTCTMHEFKGTQRKKRIDISKQQRPRYPYLWFRIQSHTFTIEQHIFCNFPWRNPHHNQDLGFSVTLKSHMSCMSSNYKGLGFFSGGTKYAALRAVFSDIMSYLIVRKINIPVFQNNSHTWNKNAYSAVWLDTNIVILLCHIFIPQELHLISFHTLPCCTGKKNCCSVKML